MLLFTRSGPENGGDKRPGGSCWTLQHFSDHSVENAAKVVLTDWPSLGQARLNITIKPNSHPWVELGFGRCRVQ